MIKQGIGGLWIMQFTILNEYERVLQALTRDLGYTEIALTTKIQW